MFLRLLFLLLLALNLGVAGWLILGDDSRPVPPATDPAVPELELLSEQGTGSQPPSAELSQAPEKAGGADMACYALGPFATEADVRRAMDALTPQVAGVQFRREQATSSRGWWVYLPAFPDRDKALDAARKLSSLGVDDYYVITAGDRENTISLGLYHNPDNARRRREDITAMGFAPVMHERTEQILQYYIDFAIPQDQTFDWRQYIDTRTGLSQRKRQCL